VKVSDAPKVKSPPTFNFDKIDWKGTSLNPIILRSDSAGLQSTLIVPTIQTVDNVDVQDSDASGGAPIYATNSTDSGNDLNWIFGGTPASVTITTPVSSITDPAWVEGDVGGDVTTLEVKVNGGTPFNAVRENPLRFYADNSSTPLGITLSDTQATLVEVTATNDNLDTNTDSQNITWTVTDLAGLFASSNSVTIRKGDSLLLTATGTGQILKIDPENDGTFEHSGAPGDKFASPYNTAGTFIAKAEIDSVEVGSLTVHVIGVDLLLPFAGQVDFERPKNFKIFPVPQAGNVSVTARDPFLLEASVDSLTAEGVQALLKARRRGDLFVQIRIPSGAVIEEGEFDEFTVDVPARKGILISEDTDSGTTKTTINPYIAGLDVTYKIFAGTSTFGGGVTEFTENTDNFTQVFNTETNEFVGIKIFEIESEEGETQACFNIDFEQQAGTGPLVTVGREPVINGPICRAFSNNTLIFMDAGSNEDTETLESQEIWVQRNAFFVSGEADTVAVDYLVAIIPDGAVNDTLDEPKLPALFDRGATCTVNSDCKPCDSTCEIVIPDFKCGTKYGKYKKLLLNCEDPTIGGESGKLIVARLDANGPDTTNTLDQFPPVAGMLKKRSGKLFETIEGEEVLIAEPVIIVLVGGEQVIDPPPVEPPITTQIPSFYGVECNGTNKWTFRAKADGFDISKHNRCWFVHKVGEARAATPDGTDEEFTTPFLTAGRWIVELEFSDGDTSEVIAIAELHTLAVEFKHSDNLPDKPVDIQDPLGTLFEFRGKTDPAFLMDTAIYADKAPNGARARVSLDGYPQNEYWGLINDILDIPQMLSLDHDDPDLIYLQGYEKFSETQADQLKLHALGQSLIEQCDPVLCGGIPETFCGTPVLEFWHHGDEEVFEVIDIQWVNHEEKDVEVATHTSKEDDAPYQREPGQPGGPGGFGGPSGGTGFPFLQDPFRFDNLIFNPPGPDGLKTITCNMISNVSAVPTNGLDQTNSFLLKQLTQDSVAYVTENGVLGLMLLTEPDGAAGGRKIFDAFVVNPIFGFQGLSTFFETGVGTNIYKTRLAMLVATLSALPDPITIQTMQAELTVDIPGSGGDLTTGSVLLTETGIDTNVFQSGDASFTVSIDRITTIGAGGVDDFTATVTSTLLGIDDKVIDAIESGNNTLEFRTDLIANQGEPIVSGNAFAAIENKYRVIIRGRGGSGAIGENAFVEIKEVMGTKTEKYRVGEKRFLVRRSTNRVEVFELLEPIIPEEIFIISKIKHTTIVAKPGRTIIAETSRGARTDMIVFGLDLTIHNGLENASGGQEICDDDEFDDGAVTVANLNDTDGDEIKDIDDTDVSVSGTNPIGRNEHDLMRLVLEEPQPEGIAGKVRIVIKKGNIKIYKDSIDPDDPAPQEEKEKRRQSKKAGEAVFPILTSDFTEDHDGNGLKDIILWVEARDWSEMQGIELEYQMQPKGEARWVLGDKVRATALWLKMTDRSPWSKKQTSSGFPNNPDPDIDLPELDEFGIINSINDVFISANGSRYGQGTQVKVGEVDTFFGGKILFEFEIKPLGVQKLGVIFDSTRQLKNREHILLQDTTPLVDSTLEHLRNYPWLWETPADNETPNDDDETASSLGEDNIPTSTGNLLYGFDAPGIRLSATKAKDSMGVEHDVAFQITRNSFKQWVRIKLNNEAFDYNPLPGFTADDGVLSVEGSRASKKVDWHNSYYVKRNLSNLFEPDSAPVSFNGPFREGQGNGSMTVELLEDADTGIYTAFYNEIGADEKRWTLVGTGGISNNSVFGDAPEGTQWTITIDSTVRVVITQGSVPFGVAQASGFIFAIFKTKNPQGKRNEIGLGSINVEQNP